MRLYTALCLVWLMCLALGATDEPKVICYYRGTAVTKIGYANMEPSEIDPHLCTHLIYAYVGVTEDGNVTVLHPQLDLPDNGGKAGFQTLNALREQNGRLKTLVATSHHNGGSTKYSKIAADKSLRSKYAKNVVDFVLHHGFDGFDIFWETPTRLGGSPDDVENFPLLLKELRASFDKHQLILSIVVDGRESWARQYYNIPEISKYVDLILMTLKSYDPAKVQHLSPLYPSPQETSSFDLTLNCDAAVHYWLDEGAPAKKLILVTQFHGQGFVLKDSTKHEPGSPAIVSRKENFDPNKSYNEICRIISRATWTTVWDEVRRVPYSYGENEWISYDNARSLVEKGRYVRSMGLGGVLVWSIDQDDRRGDCGERYPLINALNRGLRETNRSSVTRNEASTPAKTTGQVVSSSVLPSMKAEVFCYYRGAATNYIGYARMVPSDIDPNLCTHLIYSYVSLTEDGNVTIPQPRIDLPDNGGKAGFQKINALRKRNEKLKILVTSGGKDGFSAKFSKIVANESLRSKYVKNVVDFVLHHEFDGLDIHWQWPTRDGGSPNDVENFVLLLKELRVSFNQHELILSVTVEAAESYAAEFYNIPETSKYVDFIILWAIFRHFPVTTTGHHTPLYPSAKDTSSFDLSLNIDSSVHYWLNKGVPARKLVLGIFSTGRMLNVEDSDEHGPGSPTLMTNKSNTNYVDKSYSEICRLISQDTWTTVWDEEQRVPYSYGENRWITYDNVRSLIGKGEYIRAMGLRGAMLWSIDQDDHRGRCGERYPLLNALNCGLRGAGCSSIPTTEASTPAKTTGQTTFDSVLPSHQAKVVCCYRSWATNNIGYTRMAPSQIDPNLCTHLIYSHVGTTEDGNVTVLRPRIDLPDNGGKAGFEQFNALRKQNPRLKTLVSTGAKLVGGSSTFSKIAANKSLRSKYAGNVVDFLLRHQFDGFEIYWQWPTRSGGSPDDVENFVLLLKELRTRFDEHKLILSIGAEGRELNAQELYNIPEISKYVDFILLAMSFHSWRSPTTGHFSALYPSARETSSLDLSRNWDATVHYWLQQGAPAEKLIPDIYFHGQDFTLQNSAEHGPGSPSIVPAKPNLSQLERSYNEICRFISQDAWTSVWDEEQRVPYSYSKNQWISYDNARSLIEKSKYVRGMGLGGVRIWSIDQDDHQGECGERFILTKAVNCGIRDVGCSSVPTTAAFTPSKAAGQITSDSVLPSPEAKIVCFYRSRATNNIGYAKIAPSQIDPNLCTHLIYSDVGTTEDGNVTVLRPRIDLPDNGGKAGFEQLNRLREQNVRLKTLVSTGGSVTGSSATFSKIAADKSLRSKYAGNIVDFLLRYQFDGFDIYWQWPTRGGGSPDDVENFVLLLKELRARFDEHKFILSIGVEGLEVNAQKLYNIAEISKYVDLILLAMALRTWMDPTTGHFTALYPSARDVSSVDLSRNWNATVHYWLQQGAPAEKLLPSAYFHGQGFVLQNPAEHGPGSPSIVPDKPNLSQLEKSYNEICRFISQDAWTSAWDEEQRVPHSYSGNQWISYDNPRSLIEKGKYVRAMGLGGVRVWSIDQDDHQGQCGERFSLTKALNCGLRDVGCSSISTTEASRPSEATEPMASDLMLPQMGDTVSTTSKADVTFDLNDDAKSFCARFNIKYVRHPHDYAKFWICLEIRENEFHAEPFQCGPGLHFDIRRIICKPTDSMKFH